MRYHFTPLVLVCASLLASPALAQGDDGSVITVLANGLPQDTELSGQQITVFDRADIEATQGSDITRLLERVPGVTISRNGGEGSFTALRVRGAEAEQVLVMLDGVRMADPSSPGAGFDLGTLAMGNLSRVELQRSSNSTIWGSQAIGGVLLATSDTQTRTRGSLEFGSFDSFYANGGLGASLGPLDLSASGGFRQSNGFSSAASGSEADGFRQWEAIGHARLQIADELSGFARWRYADAHLDLDGFPAPAYILTDTLEFQESRQLTGASGLAYDGEALSLTASYSQARTQRENYDPAFGTAPGFTADGMSRSAQLRGKAEAGEDITLHFGGEREWTSFETLFDARAKASIWGGYLQAGYHREGLNLTAGIRRDEHRDFGGAWSFGADGSLNLTSDLRLTASYGEGFKAPSLFQLHSDYGNSALRPEKSRSFDAGFTLEKGPVSLALVAFRRETRDQIGFVSCFGVSAGICANRPFGTYDNISRTRAQGIEAELSASLTEQLTLTAIYSLIDARDRANGNQLARRPRHAATISARWEPSQALELAADLRLVSSAFEDAANSAKLDSYAILSLRAGWSLTQNLRMTARLENLADEEYQSAAGYANAGASAHAGMIMRF